MRGCYARAVVHARIDDDLKGITEDLLMQPKAFTFVVRSVSVTIITVKHDVCSYSFCKRDNVPLH
ncbi:MAG: hypothetical protein AAFR96_13125 [Planctomycetota bacterium]